MHLMLFFWVFLFQLLISPSAGDYATCKKLFGSVNFVNDCFGILQFTPAINNQMAQYACQNISGFLAFILDPSLLKAVADRLSSNAHIGLRNAAGPDGAKEWKWMLPDGTSWPALQETLLWAAGEPSDPQDTDVVGSIWRYRKAIDDISNTRLYRSAVCQFESPTKVFKQYPGNIIMSPNITILAVRNKGMCLEECFKIPLCHSFSFVASTGECKLHPLLIGDDRVDIRQDSESIVYSRISYEIQK